MSLWTSELLTGQPSSVGLLRHFVDGAFVESPSTFAKISPVTGEQIFDVCEADSETVDAAVNAARAALRGPWGRMSEQERAAVLRRVADELERRFEDLVAAEVGDTGKSISQARTLDIPRGAANFRAFADFATTAATESYTTVLPDGRRALNYAVRKPVGVVAIVVPWNLPLLLLTWKVAPALACGNAVVVKPSEETPASATVLAEVMAAAGVPPGVFNLVHGFGPSSAGEYLTRHPGVDAITFTGESATGTAIAKVAADRVKAGVVRARREERRADLRRRFDWMPRSRGRCGRSSPTAGRSACAPSGCTSNGRSSTSSAHAWPSEPPS